MAARSCLLAFALLDQWVINDHTVELGKLMWWAGMMYMYRVARVDCVVYDIFYKSIIFDRFVSKVVLELYTFLPYSLIYCSRNAQVLLVTLKSG